MRVGLALAVAGVLVRLNNVFRYPTNWGFDARFNWEYIERLMSSWTLPAPDELWASSHPPFFYYLGGAIGRILGTPGVDATVHAVRLVSTLAGLAAVGATFWLVRVADPKRPRRAVLAAGLLLFLPAHIYMSAMLNEEIMASCFISLAITGACLAALRPLDNRRELGRAAWVGLFAGLALLTKLTGLLVAFAAAAGYGARILKPSERKQAVVRAALVLGIAAIVGGWYFANNKIQYGWFYPQDLETHSIMFGMPPGSRTLADYFRVPLDTWTDPAALESLLAAFRLGEHLRHGVV